MEWNCGWCGAPPGCRYKVSCGSSTPLAVCPNPVINGFEPRKASVKTDTELTIHGDDIGGVGDLRSVEVAGVPCK